MEKGLEKEEIRGKRLLNPNDRCEHFFPKKQEPDADVYSLVGWTDSKQEKTPRHPINSN